MSIVSEEKRGRNSGRQGEGEAATMGARNEYIARSQLLLNIDEVVSLLESFCVTDNLNWGPLSFLRRCVLLPLLPETRKLVLLLAYDFDNDARSVNWSVRDYEDFAVHSLPWLVVG